MSKYIIRNCPLYIRDTKEYAEYYDFRMCKDICNCFLKQIYDIASNDVVDNNFEEPLNKILFKFDITESEDAE